MVFVLGVDGLDGVSWYAVKRFREIYSFGQEIIRVFGEYFKIPSLPRRTARTVNSGQQVSPLPSKVP